MTMGKTIKTSRTVKAKPAPAAKRAAHAKTTKAKPQAKGAAAPKPTASKQSQLIALMKAPAGATIEQLTSATGWQPHTVRGAISGSLRKRLGLTVVCAGIAGSRVYSIVAAA
jgi:hypothetical protein